MLFSENHFLWVLVLVNLIVGIGFYIIFREPVMASIWLNLEECHLEKQTVLFNWLPSFVHQFSFVILTWLSLKKSYLWFPLLFWFFINLFFEMGQAIPNDYSSHFPKIIADYFKNGRYSHEDILAIVTATIVAYVLMKIMGVRR